MKGGREGRGGDQNEGTEGVGKSWGGGSWMGVRGK